MKPPFGRRVPGRRHQGRAGAPPAVRDIETGVAAAVTTSAAPAPAGRCAQTFGAMPTTRWNSRLKSDLVLKPQGRQRLIEEKDDPVCDDPKGADRADVHARAAAAILDFVAHR